MSTRMPWIAGALALALSVACGERAVEWSAPENFLYREKSARKDDAAELVYASLVDASCEAIYQALADVEHYPEFIPGVDRVQLLAIEGGSKTVQIAQRVISRQSNAKVEWKFFPSQRRIEFRTLASDLAYNDGVYTFEPSPDGKRCLVHSTFTVKQGEGRGQSVPIGVLAQATRDAFLSAAKGVKQRAAGG
jgi:ribosome-associated toxin RatA of RatAB toxin-antitoxin module